MKIQILETHEELYEERDLERSLTLPPRDIRDREAIDSIIAKIIAQAEENNVKENNHEH